MKKLHYFIFIIILSSLFQSVQSQNSFECKTPEPDSLQRYIILNEIINQVYAKNSSTICIPIVPHIIRKTDGTGNPITLSDINAEIANFNYYFDNVGLEFYLADGSPNYIDDDNLHFNYNANRTSFINAHCNINAINIVYGNSAGPGAPSYPNTSSLPITNPPTLNKEPIEIPMISGLIPNQSTGFQNTQSPIHELGHYFGLLHTWSTTELGNCIYGFGSSENVQRTGANSNCSAIGATGGGDYCCDTEADPKFVLNQLYNTWGGSTQSGFLIDCYGDNYYPGNIGFNIMRQGFNRFIKVFTPEQENLMWNTYNHRVNVTGYQYNAPYTLNVIVPTLFSITPTFNSLTLNWTDNTNNETGYLIERSETSSTNGFKAVLNGGVGANITSFVDKTVESNKTYWYRIKPSNGDCNSYSNILSFSTGIIYCEPKNNWHPSGALCESPTCMSHITNVTIKDCNDIHYLNNSSSFNSVIADYTLNPVQLFINNSYTFEITHQNANYINVWVDWNQDGDFNDIDEHIINNISLQASNFTGNLTIPSHALEGNSRLRIRVSDNDNMPPSDQLGNTFFIPCEPCNNQGKSESEDYTLLIKKGAGAVMSFNCNTLNVSFVSSETSPAALHSWDFGSNGATSTSANPSFTFPNYGAFTVMHTVNLNGNQYLSYYCIDIPNTDFNYTYNCGRNVTFNAPQNSNFIWEFENGYTNSINSSITYNFPNTNPFNVTYTANTNSCSSSTTKTITPINSGPNFTATLVDDVICLGENLIINVSGDADEYSIDNGVTYSSITPIIITPNTASVNSLLSIYGRKFNSTCTNSQNIYYGVNTYPTLNIPNYQICNGESVTLTGSFNPLALYPIFGVGGGYTNIYYNGTQIGFFPPSGTSLPYYWPTVAPNTTTDYLFEAISPGGCATQDIVTVEVDHPINVDVGSDLTICNGNSTNLNATITGGMPDIQKWFVGPGSGTNAVAISNNLSVNVSPIANTLYGFYTSNSCGSFQDMLSISVTNIILTPQQTNVSCTGASNGSITLNSSGGTPPYQFSIDNGITFQNSNFFNNLSSGNYFISVTDANGCSASATVTITEPATLSLSTATVQNVSCFGLSDGQATASASGGTLPYTYDWGSLNANALPAGTHAVSVTDANGCSASATVTITEPTTLSLSTATVQNVSCFGLSDGQATASASGGTLPYTYDWGSLNANALPAGTHAVSVTDANGCSATATVTITEPATLSLSSATVQNVSCFGLSDGQATASASGGTLPYTYDWGSLNANALPAGTHAVSVTDANGCSASATVTITEPATLSLSTSTVQNVSCFGLSDGQATASASGGTLPYTYDWGTLNANALPAGTHTVSVTDANACSASATVTITEPATLSLSTSTVQNVSCFGLSDGQATASASGGTLPYTYDWGSLNANALPAGTHAVSVTDANGCSASATVTITEPTTLSLSTATVQNVSCFGLSDGQATASASGGTLPYTYDWGSLNANALPAGTHAVSVTDANGCSATATVTITEPAAITIALDAVTNATCSNNQDGAIDVAVSGGSGNLSYSWLDGSNTQVGTTEDISSLLPGIYTLTVTDVNSCSVSSSNITISSYPAINFTLNSSQNVSCTGADDGAIDVTVSGGSGAYSYTWTKITGYGKGGVAIVSTIANTEDLSNISGGIYTLTVTDANGCTAAYSVTITEPPLPIGTGLVTNLSYGISTQSITWNTPKFVKNTITIPDNKILNIDNTTVYFAKDVQIIVEPGGTLNISNNAILTAMCEENFWKGIQVKMEGELYSLGVRANAGKVTFTNSTIEYAKDAILSASVMYTTNVLTGVQSTSNPSYFIGGSVNAYQSNFVNCRNSLVFGSGITPNNSLPGGSLYEEGTPSNPFNIGNNYIRECSFTCTGPLPDLEYNGSGSNIFIRKYGADQALVDIKDCDFICSYNFPANQKPTGIYASTGGFKVIEGNSFDKLSKGIVIKTAENIGSVTFPNTFTNVEKGITVNNGEFNIIGNTFNNIPAATIDDNYGIRYMRVDNNQSVQLADNVFNGQASTNPSTAATYGVVVEGAANNANPTILYNNTFDGTDIGAQTQGDNTGLKIKCNYFAASGSSHSVSGLTVFDQLGDQGAGCDQNNKPAGNQWMDYCGSQTKTDIKVDAAASSFTYYAHAFVDDGTENANYSSTNPLCISTNLTKVTCDGNGINSLSLKTSTSCVDANTGWLTPGGSGGSSGFSVQTDINNLLANRNGLLTQLNSLQSQLIDPEVQKTLAEEIKQTYYNIEEYNGKIAEMYLELGDEVAYKNFLEGTTTAESKLELAMRYMDEGLFTDAQRVFQEIILLNKPTYFFQDIINEMYYTQNKEYMSQIADMEMRLKEENLSIFDLEQYEVEQLEQISQSNVAAALKADVLLQALGAPAQNYEIKKLSNLYGITSSSFDYQLTIMPNPSTVQSTVLFSMQSFENNAKIHIFDQYHNPGMLMAVYDVDRILNAVDVNTVNLESGVYWVALEIDGAFVDGALMVVIH